MKYPGRTIRIEEHDIKIVKAIQKQLIKKGVYLEIDGDFGPLTESAVKYFQSVSHDISGNPLVIDGAIGPITWSVLFEGEPSPIQGTTDRLLQKAIEFAELEVGVMENPPYSNRGKEVEEYLKAVGLPPANPWCAAFVYWCFSKASDSMGIANPLYRTGSCIEQWNHSTAKKIPQAQASENPGLIMPGNIFIIDHGCGKGHTGIVTHIENGFITTIEGNTNLDGSRAGLGVFSLTRKVNTINLGFLDYGG
ncbi:MAG: CHAP domain-containing protein [Bacteroidetes bacterium]|nr:CHAP domain-containing protein [Bacteroidota bacterium]